MFSIVTSLHPHFTFEVSSSPDPIEQIDIVPRENVGDIPLDFENPEAGTAGLESTQPLPFGQDAGSLKLLAPFAWRAAAFKSGNCYCDRALAPRPLRCRHTGIRAPKPRRAAADQSGSPPFLGSEPKTAGDLLEVTEG